jgi:hypothetical protein
MSDTNRPPPGKRSSANIILIWPLLVAPIAALVTVALSGPTYTTAPNQGAMVVRFLGLLVWLAIGGIGSLMTPLLLKSPTKSDWIAVLSAGLGSTLLFYLICTGMR